MSQDFATRLESIRDVDLLDRIYDGLINDRGADLVESLLPPLAAAMAPRGELCSPAQASSLPGPVPAMPPLES
jgi:hypothetical protein